MSLLKRVLSVITALAILISSLTLTAITVSAEEDPFMNGTGDTAADSAESGAVWSGEIATRLGGGTGTQTNPYLINTAEQLAFFASSYTQINSADKYFKLTNDIYLNALAADGFSKTNIWVNSQEPFGGHLDGDGHVVYGLYVPESRQATYAGLIPIVVTGTGSIKNVGIRYTDISAVASGAVTGAISYIGTSFVIDNCFADETVALSGDFVGGIAGMLSNNIQKLTISNCYFTGSVGTGANKGGLIGYLGANAVNNVISNCYAATADDNPVTGNTALSQSYSSVYSTAVADGTGVTLITKENLIGANAAKTGLNFFDVWLINENGYPKLLTFEKITGSDIAPEAVWSGEIASGLAGGSGTKIDPYLISTAEQLAFFATVYNQYNSGNKYFKLTNDIYLNEITEGGFNKTNIWVNSQEPFGGHLDGDGHIVYGLYVPASKQATYGGLIPLVTVGTGSINNLGVRYADITAVASGAVTGAVSYIGTSFVIDNCFADETVALSGDFIGGMSGMLSNNIQKLTISNCYFTGSVGTGGNKGGLIGYIGSNSINNVISNCYTATADRNTVTGNTALAQQYTNVYTTASTDTFGVVCLAENQLKGEAAKENTQLDFKRVWVTKDGEYPTLKAFEPKVDPDAVKAGSVWSGQIATKYAGGAGTSSDPYRISSAEQLAYFASSYTQNNSSGVYYRLTHDIYLNEITETGFEKINVWINNTSAEFSGHFDGRGHTVYGIYVPESSAAAQAALIPVVVTGTGSISNVGVKYADISGTVTGAVVGSVSYTGSNFTVENCYADETVKLSGQYVGGIAGMVAYGSAKTYISNCYSSAVINATANAGGLIGYYGANAEGGTVSYSFAITENTDNIVGFSNGKVKYDKVYSVSETDAEGVTILEKEQLIGENAFENTELDYQKYWWIRENNHPQLRSFMKKDELPVEALDIWDGVIPKEFSDKASVGSEDDPIEISTARDLAFLVKESDNTEGKYYMLTSNIFLNDTTNPNWQNESLNEWLTSDGKEYKFKGNLDGNGYVIYGLYQSKGDNAGLFTTLSGKVVNLGFANSSVNADFAGLVAAYSSDEAYISGCFGDEKTALNGSKATGGMLGKVIDGKLEIYDCYYSGTTSGKICGAVLGEISAGVQVKIQRCLNVSLTDISVIGSGEAEISGCYTLFSSEKEGVTRVEKEEIKGEKAKEILESLVFENEENENGYAEWRTVKDALPTLAMFKGNAAAPLPDYVWDGTVADGIASGDGTEDNPYLIKTPSELAWLVKNAAYESTVGKYYKLVDDIYLNITDEENWTMWGESWVAISNETVFAGNLSGNGKVIYGLYIPESSETAYAALFPKMQGGYVKQLGISGAYIYGTAAAGAITATNENAVSDIVIEECFAGSDVTVEGGDTGGLIGIARGKGLNFKNCYFVGSIGGTGFTGGLVGNAVIGNGSALNAEGCFAATDTYNLLGANNFYKLVTEADENSYLKNCYSTRTETVQSYTTESVGELETVKLSKMQGEKAMEYMSGLDYENVYSISGGTPVLKCFEQNEKFSKLFDITQSRSNIWDGTVATDFDGGDGSVHNPYRISTAEQLAFLVTVKWSSSKDLNYIITKDIYLNDVNLENWKATAKVWNQKDYTMLQGCLNGCGNIIYGLYIYDKQSSYDQGLFSQLGKTAVVQNLAFSNCDITGKICVGTIAGFIEFNTTSKVHPKVIRCFADTTVSIYSSEYAGGFVGATGGYISFYDCGFIGKLNSLREIKGGLLGNRWNNNTIDVFGCLVATEDDDVPINYHMYADYTNTYCTATLGNLTRLHLLHMQGHSDTVKEKMSGLDFENVWETAEGTPVLRIFDNTDAFTRLYTPENFTMSFDTNGGEPIKSISAMPYDKITLPKAVRGIDIFAGWFVDKELTLEFPIDFMPEYDITLYAKFISASVKNGFESYSHTLGSDGLGTDFRVYGPSVRNYEGKYVYEGVRSLQRIGEESDDQVVALFEQDTVFENTGKPLEKGKNYILTAQVYVEKTENDDGEIKLVHFSDYDIPDYELEQYTISKVGALKKSEWQEISVVFKAESEFVGLLIPGNTSMYIDDVVITPTDKNTLIQEEVTDKDVLSNTNQNEEITEDLIFQGNNGLSNGDFAENTVSEENTVIQQENTDNDESENGGYWIKKTYKTVGGIPTYVIVAISVGAAVLAAGVILAVILMVRRKRKKIPKV